jgi:putative redox protein
MSSDTPEPPLAATIADSTGNGDFQVLVRTRGATFFADETAEMGGLGTGPNPFDLLGAALAACTTMTLQLHARMNHLPLHAVHVEVVHRKETGQAIPDQFTRLIRLEGELDEDTRARLLQAAERCPVHHTLSTGARIQTHFYAN